MLRGAPFKRSLRGAVVEIESEWTVAPTQTHGHVVAPTAVNNTLILLYTMIYGNLEPVREGALG